MKKISYLKQKRLESLFTLAENYKKNNLPLSHAFIEYGEKHNVKKETARNLYYNSLNQLKEGNIHLNKDIALNSLHKREINLFTEDEERELYNYVNDRTKIGISVRKACMEYSNGNIDLMIRYQNKYRNMIKYLNKKDNKVISFRGNKKKEKKLDSSDINSLFLGLVKLIQKNAESNVNERLKNECEFATKNLYETVQKVNERDSQIKRLQSDKLSLEQIIQDQRSRISKLIEGLNKLKNGQKWDYDGNIY